MQQIVSQKGSEYLRRQFQQCVAAEQEMGYKTLLTLLLLCVVYVMMDLFLFYITYTADIRVGVSLLLYLFLPLFFSSHILRYNNISPL